MIYAYLVAAIAFVGISAFAAFEHKRADANAAVANQWKEAAQLAQTERDTARTELNKTAQEAQTKYTKDMKGVKDSYEKTIARIRSTAHSGLYVNSTCPASGAKPGEAVANSSGTPGATRSELSGPDAEFLIAFARDADNEVTQRNYAVWLLTACHKALEAP